MIARHKLETTGNAVALKAIADQEKWHADGKDLLHVRILAVDKKGRRVWDAGDKLRFSVSGDASIVAVDNGFIASDELTTGNERSLFQGSALVILRAGTKPSKVTLTVESDKYKTQQLKVNTL